MALTTTEVLEALTALPALEDGTDFVTVLKRHGPPPEGIDAAPEDPFRRLLRVATRADRRALASVAGHQAAIRRLFPQTPAGAICAFCVSEERGPHPKFIHAALRPDGGRFRLDGTKRWGSLSPHADLLYVAASIGRDGDRNDLRMVAVPAHRDGVGFDTSPYGEYGPDMSIADVLLDDVEVHADEVLPEDAYLHYIKPFRLIEDVYNTAGTQIGLFRLGLDHGWPQDRLEQLLGLVCQAAAISSTDMSSPSAILLLSAYLQASDALWDSTWQAWSDPPAQIIARWTPDRGLLGVAARAREIRRQAAWSALGT